MDKTNDKFCPDCGHHVYRDGDRYFCQICGLFVPVDELLTMEQAQPMRGEWSER